MTAMKPRYPFIGTPACLPNERIRVAGSGLQPNPGFLLSPQPCKFNIAKGRNHRLRTVARFRVLPFRELASATLAAGCNQILWYRFLLAGNM